jgi:Peptidase family M23
MAWYSGYQHPYQGFLWTWSNEKAHSGIDLPDSCGTPMTAALPGKVVVAGQYPCYGGQVSVQSTFLGQPIVYTYLHGQSHNVQVGDTVKAGQLLGYSGAPIAAACGGGCHVHFEVEHGTQAPYTGGPPQNSNAQNYPINPVPLLAYLATNKLPAGGSSVAASSTPLSATSTTTSGFDWGSFLSGIAGFFTNPASILTGLATNDPTTQLEAGLGNFGSWILTPIRLIKLVAGGLLLVVSLWGTFILPAEAPIAAGVATAALGAPEAAPAVAEAVHSAVKPRSKKQPPAPTPPASQAVPQAVGAVGYARRTDSLRAMARAPITQPIIIQQPPAPPPQAAPSTAPLRGQTARPNPMTAEEIAALHPVPPVAPEPPVAPAGSTVQRAQPTGLVSKTYFKRYRTVQTNTPYSDQDAARVKELMKRRRPDRTLRKPRAQNKMSIEELHHLTRQQLTKASARRLQEFSKAGSVYSPAEIDETMRGLRGES